MGPLTQLLLLTTIWEDASVVPVATPPTLLSASMVKPKRLFPVLQVLLSPLVSQPASHTICLSRTGSPLPLLPVLLPSLRLNGTCLLKDLTALLLWLLVRLLPHALVPPSN